MNNKKLKFIELAERRVGKTLHMLKLIKNLSNRSHYEYDEKQVGKIIRALESEIQSLKSAFKAGITKDKGFKL
jgi:hypothetical protein